MVKRKIGKDIQKKRKASETNLLNVYYILGIKYAFLQMLYIL